MAKNNPFGGKPAQKPNNKKPVPERPKEKRKNKNKGPKDAPWLGKRPGKPKELSSEKITTDAIAQGERLSDAQMADYAGTFQTLADQQSQQIDRLAAGLNNQYTQDARNQVNQSFGELDRMGAMGNEASAIGDQYSTQIGALGTMLGDQARQGFATSGPTSIEQELYRQGEAELALGRSLSPEQIREATQSARQAFAARGLGTGLGAASQELLNRDRYATQRQADRRTFAQTANNLREQNVLARREQAGNFTTQSGNLMDAAGRLGMTGRQIGGALLGEASRLRQTGSTLLADLDPYARAMNPGLSLGQTAMQAGLAQSGDAYKSALELAGNTASFNTNLASDLYTNYMDNLAAVKGANKQADAIRSTAPGPFETTMNTISNVLNPAKWSDRRMKTDIKPLGKAGGVLGLTAYEYRYKGDDKKHVGFIAQDVRKVLPQAVTEVNHNGKKRLAIKPSVIGAALARELMAAKAA